MELDDKNDYLFVDSDPTMQMESKDSSEMSVVKNQTTRCHISNSRKIVTERYIKIIDLYEYLLQIVFSPSCLKQCFKYGLYFLLQE